MPQDTGKGGNPRALSKCARRADAAGGGQVAWQPTMPGGTVQRRAAADPWTHFLAGAASGVLVGVALQPLDVIRTHLQAPAPPGTRRTVVSIARELGLRGLWRGTAPTAIRIGIGAGLYFSLLDSMVRAMKALPGVADRAGGGGKELPAGLTLIAGGATRSVCAVLLCPLTVVKTRMEYTGTAGSGRSGTLAALAAIARTEGLRGLFSGLGPTIVRDAPYSGLYLLLYTRLRTRLHEHVLPQGSPQRYANLLAGGCAGAVSTLVTHPADVVRTRLQLEGAKARSVRDVVRQVYQAQGLRGFLAGAIPRMGKRALQQALQWTIYEEMLSLLGSTSIWGASGGAEGSGAGGDSAPAGGSAEAGP